MRGRIVASWYMHSRASQTLSVAFAADRGAQMRLSVRTGISQSRLSRLAKGGASPNLEHSLKLKSDPEIPIDPTWWSLPAQKKKPLKGAA